MKNKNIYLPKSDTRPYERPWLTIFLFFVVLLATSMALGAMIGIVMSYNRMPV